MQSGFYTSQGLADVQSTAWPLRLSSLAIDTKKNLATRPTNSPMPSRRSDQIHIREKGSGGQCAPVSIVRRMVADVQGAALDLG